MRHPSQDLRVIVFDGKNTRCMKDFLTLPKRLYSVRERTQNPDTERALLSGSHILSGYFSVTPILVYRGKTALSRVMLTVYPDDDMAYLGFLRAKTTAKPQHCCFKLQSASPGRKGER